MHVIHARNVNDAYRAGLRLVATTGEIEPSRNGAVRRMVDPVTTVYSHPWERVLFDDQRNANPFFHLMEALWMLSGGNDVQTLDHILGSFKQFSDDGTTFHGAYGYRWRHWPIHDVGPYIREVDQLTRVIQMLGRDPSSRRAVIGMWDPARDLDRISKDLPCNDLIKVAIVQGALDIQVYNRSNDIVFGCYGANAVHMSVLQEYLAAMLGVPIGRYFQISGDYHAYLDEPYRLDQYWPLHEDDKCWENPYSSSSEAQIRDLHTCPLVSDPLSFDEELTMFIRAIRDLRTVAYLHPNDFHNDFFPNVAIPMHWAFEHYLAKEYGLALTTLDALLDHHPNDWLYAGHAWISRRASAKMAMARA